jgi:PAS domain S-box-containing protein
MRAEGVATEELATAITELLESARRSRAERDAAIRERDAQAHAFAEAQEQLRREIVERERAYRELARQRSVLQQIIDTVPYSIFWKDRDSVYLGANQKKLDALGFASIEALVGVTDYDTGVRREEADFYRSIDRKVMEAGQPILNLEETQLRPDGPHVLLTSKVPLRDDAGAVTGILGIYVDITERKRMETELARAKEAAETAARARSDFLAAISHELRTPLTLILGPLEELLGDAGTGLSAGARVQLERIRRNARRLFGLVNDVLDFTKLEAGKMEVHWEPVDVVALVGEMVEDARSVAERKDISLGFAPEADIGPLPADRAKLEKIVLNLVGNALKFTPAGGSIDVAVRCAGDDAEISVSDTGPGIPSEKHRLIFERFQQLDSSFTRRYPGSGLGLAVVKELTELMGGRVGVESEQDRGSRFWVRLPRCSDRLVEAQEVGTGESVGPRDSAAQLERVSALFQVAGPQPAGDSGARRPGESERPVVLVAEDDGDMRAYMRDILAGRYDVVPVENGQQALEAVRSRLPAVVVADIMMPELDGLELVSSLKADPKLRRIQVVLVTAKASREEVVSGLDVGADDYLSKPFGPAELLARVRAAERQCRMFEELEVKRRELESALDNLRATQEELMQVGKMAAVGTLAAGMSHELNNPLATILMASQSLLRQLPANSPWRDAIEIIERQAARSGRLVKLLLDFSRRKPAATERIAIEDLMNRVVELAKSQIQGGNVSLQVERLERCLPPVEVSVQQMEVALLNVVKNGLDATASGGRVRLAARAPGRAGALGVEIQVSDTGSGIPPEVLPRIFDPFFTTKAVGQGTGLGLSLARRIVESHGGEIRVQSKVGSGTTMRVWLPSAVP